MQDRARKIAEYKVNTQRGSTFLQDKVETMATYNRDKEGHLMSRPQPHKYQLTYTNIGF